MKDLCPQRHERVNYMETNQSYATYEDGTPVKMRLNLQFTEVNPIYAEDYDTIDKMELVTDDIF